MDSMVIEFGRFGTAELKSKKLLKDKSKGVLVLRIYTNTGTIRDQQIIEDTLSLAADQCDALTSIQHRGVHVILVFNLNIVPPALMIELFDLYLEDLTLFLANGVVEKVAQLYPLPTPEVAQTHEVTV